MYKRSTDNTVIIKNPTAMVQTNTTNGRQLTVKKYNKSLYLNIFRKTIFVANNELSSTNSHSHGVP